MTGIELYITVMIPFLGFCSLYVVFQHCLDLFLGKEVGDEFCD